MAIGSKFNSLVDKSPIRQTSISQVLKTDSLLIQHNRIDTTTFFIDATSAHQGEQVAA